jgi:hypothetical protein
MHIPSISQRDLYTPFDQIISDLLVQRAAANALQTGLGSGELQFSTLTMFSIFLRLAM